MDWCVASRGGGYNDHVSLSMLYECLLNWWWENLGSNFWLRWKIPQAVHTLNPPFYFASLSWCSSLFSMILNSPGLLRLHIGGADLAENDFGSWRWKEAGFNPLLHSDDPKLRTAWTFVMISTGITWVLKTYLYPHHLVSILVSKALLSGFLDAFADR